jgi:CRP-like cAMP-binding protein
MPHLHYPHVIDKLGLFAGLTPDERARAVRGGRICFYPRSQTVFQAGDPVTRFFIVCSGAIQLFKQTGKGGRLTTEVRSVGQTIGTSAICSRLCAHYQVHAQAVQDSAVAEFPAQWLIKFAAQYPAVAENVMASLARRALMKDVEIERRCTMNAAQQLACFLHRLCVKHRLDPKGFELPYSKALIASMLGMEPETLSRILSKLPALGIEVEDTHVRIAAPERIRQHICRLCTIADWCPANQAQPGHP